MTRCQPAWQAQTKPSRIYQHLLTTLGLIAIATTGLYNPLNPWLRIIIGAVVLALLLRQLQQTRQQRLSIIHVPHDAWLIRGHGSAVSGQLAEAGYRSASVLVMVIQGDNGHWHRQAIWCDQVDGQAFSYLQQQLAFASESPVRRSFKVWLSDLRSMLD